MFHTHLVGAWEGIRTVDDVHSKIQKREELFSSKVAQFLSAYT
jgi:hypothetical protein